MGPVEIQKTRHHQQQQYNEIVSSSDTSNEKYSVHFLPGYTTVDGPPPPPSRSSSTSSNNSAAQRHLRSGPLRFATFQGWPHDFLSPRLLAEAGFFYRGTGDQTQCAFCCITISSWEPQDDPMTEHRKYAPNCPFVLGFPVGNIPLAGARSAEASPAQAAPADPPSPVSSFPTSLFRGGTDVCGFRQEIRPHALPDRRGIQLFPSIYI